MIRGEIKDGEEGKGPIPFVGFVGVPVSVFWLKKGS